MTDRHVLTLPRLGTEGTARCPQVTRISTADTDALASPHLKIGAGESRVVYDLGSAVLKIDRPDGDGDWAGACKTEIRRWVSAHDAYRHLLCPILAWDTLDEKWLVMSKVTMPTLTELLPDGRAKSVEYRVLTTELLGYGISDLHAKNVGWLPNPDGTRRLVAIDYAF